jgi:hypothetical protein
MKNATVDKVISLYAKGKAGPNILSYGEAAVYECLPGFTAGGEPDAETTYNVECLPTGEFAAPAEDMQCRNVNDCETATCGPNGQCVDLVGPAPAYTCICEHGYDLRDRKNGHKYCGNTDDCKGQDCGVGTCKDMVGGYTCICPSGYYIGEKDGEKTCIPVRCSDDTPSLDNGKQISDHSGTIDFPDTLEYGCNEGYSIDSSIAEAKKKFHLQCKSDGSLYGMQECKKITCGAARALPFTNITVPSNPQKDILFKDKAEYTCFEGYTLGGQASGDKKFEIECKSNGKLTNPKVCEPVVCGEAPIVPKCRAAISGDVLFGMKLEYMCDTGYTLNQRLDGPKIFERKCQKDGKFSALPREQPCQPISAGKAPTVAHAIMSEYAGKSVEVFPPEVFYPKGLEYQCLDGYSENGSPDGPTKIAVKVNSQATLTPALPTECKLITYTVKGMIKNAKNGAMLSNVKVKVKGQTSTTKSDGGFYELEGVAPGNVTLEFSKNNFITAERPLVVTGHVSSGGMSDINLSPVLGVGEWRAVLKWGEKPKDLDAYMRWGWSKVCASQKDRRSNHIIGKLERDVTKGFGPETLLMRGIGKCDGTGNRCDVRYEVNSEKGGLLDSKALVTLYTGDSVAGTFKISDCKNTVRENGKWWHVFTLNGEKNEIKWRCTSGEPAPLNSAAMQQFLKAKEQWLANKKRCEAAKKLAVETKDAITEGIQKSSKTQGSIAKKNQRSI